MLDAPENGFLAEKLHDLEETRAGRAAGQGDPDRMDDLSGVHALLLGKRPDGGFQRRHAPG